jgi:hypothetical protein
MIFHYTSIETLALILESKKLRFTRLDRLDDLQEHSLYEGFKIHLSHFVSCWTENSNENVALWKMYSDMHGVRIGLDIADINLPRGDVPEILKYDGFFIIPGTIIPYFQKVSYLNDIDLRETIRATVKKEGKTITIGNNGLAVGGFKSKYWEFQNESRFVLQIISLKNGFDRGIKEMLNEDMQEEWFDIPVFNTIIPTMEITLGPLCTPAEKLIVKALIKSYEVNIELKESSLKNIIRNKA